MEGGAALSVIVALPTIESMAALDLGLDADGICLQPEGWASPIEMRWVAAVAAVGRTDAVDVEGATAKFSKKSHELKVRVPLLPTTL